MYSLFLVEDEELELDVLREHIDWSSMDIKIAGYAMNGKRAWEQIQELRPDIVLTDVRMPIMDGLRLAERIREKCEGMKVVFLSGHDEFRFVRSAIESGAVGYLLKPVDPEELAAAMNKVKAEVDKARLLDLSRRVLLDQWLLRLATGSKRSREQAWTELLEMEPGIREQIYESGLIVPDRQLEQTEQEELAQVARRVLEQEGRSGAIARTGEDEWFVAILGEAEEGLAPEQGGIWLRLSEAIGGAYGVTFTIGLASKSRPLLESPAMLGEARAAVAYRFHLGRGRVISYAAGAAQDDRLGEGQGSRFGELLQAWSLETLTEAKAEMERYIASASERRETRETVIAQASELLERLGAELGRYDDWTARGLGGADRWKREILSMVTLAEIGSYIRGLLASLESYVADRRQDRHNLLARQVADIIEERYSEPLTIEELAGKVFLSPNYLRALFKEKMGCTIHDYLTDVRLRRSLELLRDRSLRIKDVARMSGYDNTSYFCSIFYKTQGVTPNDYRNKFL